MRLFFFQTMKTQKWRTIFPVTHFSHFCLKNLKRPSWWQLKLQTIAGASSVTKKRRKVKLCFCHFPNTGSTFTVIIFPVFSLLAWEDWSYLLPRSGFFLSAKKTVSYFQPLSACSWQVGSLYLLLTSCDTFITEILLCPWTLIVPQV